MSNNVSILFPDLENVKYVQLSSVTCHDLGMDAVCKQLAANEKEEKLIMSVLSNLSSDSRVARYRAEVFEDMIKLPSMRNTMKELLDQVQMLKDFGIMKREFDKKSGLWDLLHRLDEINDYINCVEAISKCLGANDIKSEGLLNLKAFVNSIIEDSSFDGMKKDIENLKANTSNLQSITVGINLNSRFEAESLGLISVNNQKFKSSGILSSFTEALASKDGVSQGNEWNGDMHYHDIDSKSMTPFKTVEKFAGFMALQQTPLIDSRTRESIVNIPENGGEETPFYLDQVISKMLNHLVKNLKEILSKYVTVAVANITGLIPEFVYYIRTAEFIEKLREKKYSFCIPTPVDKSEDAGLMEACGIYNLKLASSGVCSAEEIVANDLIFDRDNMLYILTGANRGGKTTITQAVGICYVLAQGGIYVPADSFCYVPVDAIYTHFPADEDKTMDLGRLGEECTRFKEIYNSATEDSLVLMNETFSTTSFEEGYYIAVDSVKALLSKGVRTIYNTHMHKLAYDLDSINSDEYSSKACSLVMKSDVGKRSFKVAVAPPEGMSYAVDIARKYGVTYDMLIGNN